MTIRFNIDKQIQKDGLQRVQLVITDGKSGTPNHFRKYIATKVKIKSKFFDAKNFRALSKHFDQDGINKTLKELEERRDTALSNFYNNNWAHLQVVNLLKGRDDFETVDDYIEIIIKEHSKPVTYDDYRYALKGFKKHLNIQGVVTFDFLANYNNLDRFKRNAQNGKYGKPLAGTSINSYFKKFTAILNDAYDRNYRHKKFKRNKKLKCATQPKQVESITPDQLLKAIDNIKTIRDWQAVAFYLLMFLTRGMYLTDIADFTWLKLKNSKIKVDYSTLENYLDVFSSDYFKKGYDYLVHRRHKTKDQSNPDMVIRIDKHPTGDLIQVLRTTIEYTHYKTKPEILPSSLDDLKIFDYDINDSKLHRNIWDSYQTRIKRLLGAPYITARKTFTTYAGELEISDIIRRVLIGHVDQSMLSHYTNLNTLEFKQQVEDAHLKVLEKFRAYDLANELFDKLQAVDAPKWVNLTLESFDDLTQKDIDEMVKVKNIIKKAHKRKKG